MHVADKLYLSCGPLYAQGIIVPPEAINITLNEETVFTCTAVGDHINWRANNTPVNEIIGKGIDDLNMRVPVNATEHIYLEKLRVVGSYFSNASTIVCQSVLLLEGKFTVAASDPVLLLVQGKYKTCICCYNAGMTYSHL